MVVRRAAGRIVRGDLECAGGFCRGLLGSVIPDPRRSGIVSGKPGGCRDSKGWRLNDVPRLLPLARTAVRRDSGSALLVFQPGSQRSVGVAFLWNRDGPWISVARGRARDGQDHVAFPVAQALERPCAQRLPVSNAMRFA